MDDLISRQEAIKEAAAVKLPPDETRDHELNCCNRPA